MRTLRAYGLNASSKSVNIGVRLLADSAISDDLMRPRIAASIVLVAAAAHAATLEFLRDGTVVRRLDDATLAKRCGVRTIEVDDPYYEARKRYRACPLARVIEAGFGRSLDALDGEEDVLFRALDGYVKPSTLGRVGEEGGFVALGDADRASGFSPVGRRGLDPGPFYVVWTKPGQGDTHRHPWPYQLAAIELARLEKTFPHVAPTGLPRDDPGWRGYAIFRGECIACHSVNGEGGTVGPDLNVPRSIVEYRPVEQLKAYIRDPGAFRYGAMPPHEHLSAADLDALVAYFRAMAARKHDPGRRP
jgi:mono/diheme cytochrome c family protein